MVGRGGVLALLGLAVAAACGSGEGQEGPTNACGPAPAALAGEPELPPGFPTPEGVRYTADRQAGPSRIVEGYRDGDIEAAYEAYKDAFPDAGYEVTKDEREVVDAEVNFAGGSSTGQVKLLQECEDRTTVAITIRPE